MQQQPWQRPWRPPRLKRASLPYYFLSDYALWRRPKNSPLLIHTTYFTCFGRSVGPNGTFGRLKAGYKELLLPGELGPVHHHCHCSGSSRNAAADGCGCCNHHQAGGVWGRVGEPSEGLPAREHRYSIAASSTLSYPLLLLRSKRRGSLQQANRTMGWTQQPFASLYE